MRRDPAFVPYALFLVAACAPLAAQAQGRAPRSEEVSYWNEADSTLLTATLVLPSGTGPHPGVVLLSIAGTDPVVERLIGEGYAVLQPVRRGFVAVEPLLRATYEDLAGDARAALSYLGARAEVDPEAIALIGQGDDAPAAIIAAAESAADIPLVLLAPPGLPAREVFLLEQRELAERAGFRAADLAALDGFVGEIADIVVSDGAPYVREYRLQGLIARSRVELPYSAELPNDERQAHFFASPIWHSRLTFDPVAALGRLHAPVLLLVGLEEPTTPVDEYLAAVRSGLSVASTPDWTVCLVPGRVRHSFSEQGVSALVSWVGDRIADRGGRPRALTACVEDP